MSAIIAGKECKGCKQEYYSSLGHPKWFDTGLRAAADPTQKEKVNGKYKAFNRLRKLGYCLSCIAGKLAGKKALKDLRYLLGNN